MRTFIFEFDELPLVIRNGIEAALADGQVEVEYTKQGDWGTGHVTVTGFGYRDSNGKREWPQVPCPPALARIIVHRLEHEWRNKVQDAVNERIESDHIAGQDELAGMKREERYLDR